MTTRQGGKNLGSLSVRYLYLIFYIKFLALFYMQNIGFMKLEPVLICMNHMKCSKEQFCLERAQSLGGSQEVDMGP